MKRNTPVSKNASITPLVQCSPLWWHCYSVTHPQKGWLESRVSDNNKHSSGGGSSPPSCFAVTFCSCGEADIIWRLYFHSRKTPLPKVPPLLKKSFFVYYGRIALTICHTVHPPLLIELQLFICIKFWSYTKEMNAEKRCIWTLTIIWPLYSLKHRGH